MSGNFIAFLLGLFLGGGVGFLIAGCFALEGRADDMEDARNTINKQARTIEKQSIIIAGLRKQLDEMEDDYK